jgi:hypothetical protein
MARHRKHIKNPYLPYDKAKEYVLEQHPRITTRAQYWRWHDDYKPAFLPKRPDKVWDDFSWNDFLNTNNSFEKTILARKGAKRHYRTYWEAVRYAQAQAKKFQLSTREQWLTFYEQYEVPDDIPKRPWQEYDDFSIDVWLGLDAAAHLKTAKEGVVAIVGLHRISEMPPNCVTFRVWKNGYAAMKSALLDGDESGMIGPPYQLWKWDESGMKVALDKLERHGHKRDGYYVVPNMHALMWELNECLDIFKQG